jgi:hypothetical protein
VPARQASILTSVAVVAAGVSLARADGGLFEDDLLTPPPDRYTIRFEPSAFYAAPGGELILPGSPPGTIEADLADFDLDKPRMSPYGELHLRRGDWRATLTSFAVSLDDVATTAVTAGQLGPLAIGAGDRVVSSMDFAMGELLVARQLGGPDRFNGIIDPDFAMAVEAFGGARFYHVAFDFEAPAGSVSADEFFIHPICGAKFTMNILRRFDIDLQVAFGGMLTGGDRSSFSIEILNGYTYRPIENVGVQIGYRLSFYSLNSGSGTSAFEYTGAVAGIFAGVVIRF